MRKILLFIIGFAIGLLVHSMLIGILSFVGMLTHTAILGMYTSSGLSTPIALLIYCICIYLAITRE